MAQDTPFTVVDNPNPASANPQAPQPVEINVDAPTAFAVKLQEFDKAIAETEAQAAALKAQKAGFIYQTNIDALVAQDKAKKDQAGQAPAQETTK